MLTKLLTYSDFKKPLCLENLLTLGISRSKTCRNLSNRKRWTGRELNHASKGVHILITSIGSLLRYLQGRLGFDVLWTVVNRVLVWSSRIAQEMF